MKTPQYLTRGDLVAIVPTARYINRVDIFEAEELLRSWKLEPYLGDSIGAVCHQFAGDDVTRAKAFQNLLDNPNIKAIWCAKGGYGTVRIMNRLDFSAFLNTPKWVIGYSDITVLLSHLEQSGVASIHGPMPSALNRCTSEALLSLKKALFGLPLQYSMKTSFVKDFCLEGEVVGGNLSVLYSLLGSKLSIDTKGKILIIEDLDEYLYHIDRMMMNLKNNGYLSKIQALLVGGMTDMHDNDIAFGKTAKEIIIEHTQEYNYPVIFNVPFGHIADNMSFYIGKQIKISCRKGMMTMSY